MFIFPPEPDIWHTPDFYVAVCTGLLALGTFWLALRTSSMAKDAKLAREDAARQTAQDDLHHRQQLTGLIVLTDARIYFIPGTHELIVEATALNPTSSAPALSGVVFLSVPGLNINRQGEPIGTLVAGQSEPVRFVTYMKSAARDGNLLQNSMLTVSFKNVFNEYRKTEYASDDSLPLQLLAGPQRTFNELPINMNDVRMEPFTPDD